MSGRRARPASLLLVHGAGSGPGIYDDWPASFPELDVEAVDLQHGLDVGSASMDDYASRVVAAASGLPDPVSICGWSMGGLVAMLAAGRLARRPHSLVLIESSPPGEVQGFLPALDLAAPGGAFDPQSVYGVFPAGVRARLESSRARAARKRGISIPALPCPSLVIYGDEFPDERGRQIARHYRSEIAAFSGLDHWALIRDKRVRKAIHAFYARLDDKDTWRRRRGEPPRDGRAKQGGQTPVQQSGLDRAHATAR